MPLSKTSKKVKKSMQDTYGKKKGEQVFYATAAKKTGKQGRAEKASTWKKKDPQGGYDKAEHVCPHCKGKLTKYLGGKGFTRVPQADIPDTHAGNWACDNEKCPCIKEKGRKYAVPIPYAVSEGVISQNVEIILDGKKYLLEAGDNIKIMDKPEKTIECRREKKPTKHFYNGATEDLYGNKKHFWTCNSCRSTFIHEFGPDNENY